MFRQLKYIIILLFVVYSLGPLPNSQAQGLEGVFMPKPGVSVQLSPPVNVPALKGIKVYQSNSFKLEFILDGQDSVVTEHTKTLIQYFLASLTTPENDLWVNLSPYEKDRIISDKLGQTILGRDLLAQDYLLKQITASLMHPDSDVGKKFWKKIYQQALEKFGTTNVPVNTINKVWIVPDKAEIFDNSKGTAYITKATLKVMLEEDYLASHHAGLTASQGNPASRLQSSQPNWQNAIIREIIIPELTKEVNEGKNFAPLRQVYQSIILAAWYKRTIKSNVLVTQFIDQHKIQGIHIAAQTDNIYQQYLQAYKKGVANFVREEKEGLTEKTNVRKYFTGGENFGQKQIDEAMRVTYQQPVLDDTVKQRRIIVELKADVNNAMIADDVRAIMQFYQNDLSAKVIEVLNKYDVDTRVVSNHFMHPIEVLLLSLTRRLVNEKNKKDFKGIYLGAGADVSGFFLATNAEEGLFIDQTELNADELKRYLDANEWSNLEYAPNASGGFDQRVRNEYMRIKWANGAGDSEAGKMRNINRRIMLELKMLGVDPRAIIVTERKENGVSEINIEFMWGYNQEVSRKRTIRFVKEKIRAVSDVTKIVGAELYDSLMVKAGFNLMQHPESGLINSWIKVIKPQGALIFDPYYFSTETQLKSAPLSGVSVAKDYYGYSNIGKHLPQEVTRIDDLHIRAVLSVWLNEEQRINGDKNLNGHALWGLDIDSRAIDEFELFIRQLRATYPAEVLKGFEKFLYGKSLEIYKVGGQDVAMSVSDTLNAIFKEDLNKVLAFIGEDIENIARVDYGLEGIHADVWHLNIFLKDGREKSCFVKESAKMLDRSFEAMTVGAGPRIMALTGSSHYRYIEEKAQGDGLYSDKVILRDANDALGLVRGLAYVLGRLHGAGIVHTDLIDDQGGQDLAEAEKLLHREHIFVQSHADRWNVMFIDYDYAQQELLVQEQSEKKKEIKRVELALKNYLKRYNKLTRFAELYEYSPSGGKFWADFSRAFHESYATGFDETNTDRELIVEQHEGGVDFKGVNQEVIVNQSGRDSQFQVNPMNTVIKHGLTFNIINTSTVNLQDWLLN